MPLSASKINKWKATEKEHWERMGNSCYLVVAKKPTKSKRFVGVATIAGKKYKVPLGVWGKDFDCPNDVLRKWDEIKSWAKEKQCDPKKFKERNSIKKSEKTFKEVCDLFLKWKREHTKDDSYTTMKNRLGQTLQRLPEGILISDFAGMEGTQFIKQRVIDPSVNSNKPYTGKRHRRLLNNVFEFAVQELLLHPELIPLNLDKPFPFEKNIPKPQPHPHLPWSEFREVIQKINDNPVNAKRLTDLAVKASLLMMVRVSVVVSLRWDMFDEKNKVWKIPPDTKGLKRKFGDDMNYHFIPHTPQLEVLMNNLWAINGHQEYVFWSANKGSNPYLSSQTPNDHLKNLGFKGKQDAHGFRHVVTNALVDIKQKDEKMVSRCLSHLFKEGSIGNYDFAKRLEQRRDIHECWNQLLIDEGLKI